MSPSDRPSRKRYPDEPKERPVIGPTAWFERHLWRWHPITVGHDEALAVFLREFPDSWRKDSKNAHADWIYKHHRADLREWRGLSPANIPTMSDWLTYDIRPPHPEFAKVCHEIIKAQMAHGIPAADCATMLEPLLGDPILGRPCRHLHARFVYDAEHPSRPGTFIPPDSPTVPNVIQEFAW